MASTKKILEEDFTNQKQAQTAQDVNNQDARTRLWQSLDYSYNKQQEQSDKSFDKAISEADRAALARGMGRSSYNLQTQANLLNQKVKAQNDIAAAKIADYQSRIGEIENQEKEDERWERQFAENQRQYNESLAFQQSESARSQANWEKEYNANRSDTAWNQTFQQSQLDYQKSRDVISDAQWQKEYDEKLRQFNEQMAYEKERANVSDAQWQQTYNENLRQFNEQMAYQRERAKASDTQFQQQFQYQQQRDTVADQQWQQQYNEQLRQFNEQMAYQRERANVSDAQWQQTYNENLRQFNEQMAQAERQFKANYDFQVSEANRQQQNWEIQQAFNERQWEVQQAQWREEFDYNKMSNDQKIAFEAIVTAASNRGDVSDALLAKVGLSRADYNAMKAQAQSGGGYVKNNTNGGNEEGDINTGNLNSNEFLSIMDQYQPGNSKLNSSSGNANHVPFNSSINQVLKKTTK